MSFAPMNLTPSLTGCCPGRTKYPPPSLTTNLADMQPSWQGLPCPAPPPQSKSPYPAWGFNAFNHVNQAGADLGDKLLGLRSPYY
ncbi:hypothetical protein PtA15_8A222 [Puccinia triticina]|uniref:Uncharacterized protein n=1 Tax=Puccinia triticina TaxID=208348 RepID=A0ABY7CQV3_9BASI|nr:uncharacterized protein PtA15_8A222 [Puccinia triticina]WAQ87318.1 hypothetical protein PtA15_8A222 [Puccinia triticina]